MISHVQRSQRALTAVQRHLRQLGVWAVPQRLVYERCAVLVVVRQKKPVASAGLIGVRVSRPRWGTKHVTAHSALTGRRKRYHYRYRYCHWNLHSHGKPVAAQPDVWVLVIAGRPLREAIVVPA